MTMESTARKRSLEDEDITFPKKRALLSAVDNKPQANGVEHDAELPESDNLEVPAMLQTLQSSTSSNVPIMSSCFARRQYIGE